MRREPDAANEQVERDKVHNCGLEEARIAHKSPGINA
jgi:hypothetical protein